MKIAQSVAVAVALVCMVSTFLPDYVYALDGEFIEVLEGEKEAEENKESKEACEVDDFTHHQLQAAFFLPANKRAATEAQYSRLVHFMEIPTPPPERG